MNVDNDTIERFIVWDYIESFESIGYNDVQSKEYENINHVVQLLSKYKYPIIFFDYVFDPLFNKIFSHKSKSTNHKNNFKIVCHSPKNLSIFYDLKKWHYNIGLIVYGKYDRFSAIKNLMWYFNVSDLYIFMADYILNKDANILVRMLIQIEEKLKKIRPDYIVLANDSTPIERSIILASNNLGITTIVIQHGIYDLKSQPFDGRIADYVLVWGQYFKDLYVKQGIRKDEEVYVLGYPYKIEENINMSKRNSYRVYYLGQNFERYNKANLDIKLETLNGINKICLKLDMQFYYRPHPGDDRKLLQKKLPHINFTQKKETLTQSFSKGDIFITFNSTSLIEASMRSKLCIQLINYPYSCDNFEKLGVCSKSVENIDDLEAYLDTITRSNDLSVKLLFNNEYIDITKNPSKSFLNILNEIEKTKNAHNSC